jgi:hypothetical protein
MSRMIHIWIVKRSSHECSAYIRGSRPWPMVGTESRKRNLALLGEKGKEKVLSLRKTSSLT